MSPQEIDALRKEVKKRLVDLDLDRRGSLQTLAREMTRKGGESVNKNSLTMALTGYRAGPSAQKLLKELGGMLETWPPDKPLQRDFTHK